MNKILLYINCMCSLILDTVMILSFWIMIMASCLNVRVMTANCLDVWKFRDFTVVVIICMILC